MTEEETRNECGDYLGYLARNCEQRGTVPMGYTLHTNLIGLVAVASQFETILNRTHMHAARRPGEESARLKRESSFQTLTRRDTRDEQLHSRHWSEGQAAFAANLRSCSRCLHVGNGSTDLRLTWLPTPHCLDATSITHAKGTAASDLDSL